MAESAPAASNVPDPAASHPHTEPSALQRWDDQSDLAHPTRPPGPGLLEAACWVVGLSIAQIVGLVAVLGILFVALVFPGGGFETAELARTLKNPKSLVELQDTLSVPVFAGSQVIFVAMVLIAVRLRLGRQIRRLIATKSLLPAHAVLIVLAVLPVSVLSTKTYVWFTMVVWDPLTTRYQWLSQLDGLSSMSVLDELVQTTPMWVLLLAIAVAPALWEELVFRGMIGRGLIARWGVPAGVLITSVMFAAMHVHPAHVVGVIPLGIAMHFVYIATRSFWAPVLFHFLNNALAVLFAKQLLETASAGEAVDMGMRIGLTPVDLSTGWVLASLSCAAAIGLRLWSTRVRYHLPDGELWSPGYNSVEAPPADVRIQRITTGDKDWSFALVVASLLLFVTAWFMAAGGV